MTPVDSPVLMTILRPARPARPGRPVARRPGWPRVLAGRTGGWWLVAAAVTFTVAELAFVPVRMGLSWDEVVYASQVSAHAPASYFDSARARGVSVLVAPVTLVTSSLVALRVYLSVATGLGLLTALWPWRRLRPGWQLALAGVLFGGLWTTQYYGPEVMPDLWSALSALAAVGCFLSFTTGRGGRGALTGLADGVACAALFRPGDAVYLTVPLILAVLTISAWRRWELVVAALSGLVTGAAEWIIEADERFGGVASRLHLSGIEQGGFGLHFSLVAYWRALNGPTLCRPCTAAVTDPGPGLWWLALPLLVVAGVLAARRAGRLGSALLPAVCALGLTAQYIFMINYAAPRFLLPAYALLAMPVADGLAWVLTGSGGNCARPRPPSRCACWRPSSSASTSCWNVRPPRRWPTPTTTRRWPMISRRWACGRRACSAAVRTCRSPTT